MPDIAKDGFVSLEDPFNAELRASVRPEEWKNPEPAGRYNVVVIGAGTAGLVTAAGVTVDFPAVMERMRRLRARIAPSDSAQRFSNLGVDVYLRKRLTQRIKNFACRLMTAKR